MFRNFDIITLDLVVSCKFVQHLKINTICIMRICVLIIADHESKSNVVVCLQMVVLVGTH